LRPAINAQGHDTAARFGAILGDPAEWQSGFHLAKRVPLCSSTVSLAPPPIDLMRSASVLPRHASSGVAGSWPAWIPG
jgi:hypothetical protein